MAVVFDMDNTLTDEFGREVRPGMKDLLAKLQKEKFVLVLWTSSARSRAREILSQHKLEQYFSKFIFREDYDPDKKGLPKDIRQVNGWFLVDDDPRQIKFLESIGIAAFQISPYRGGAKGDQEELKKLYQAILASRPNKGILDWLRRI
ncbi:MAG: DUF705 domain-containing protein [Magnetococcales bacterium]|nr:DUF705 domain-containing protein [Magnetococcales bacterium]MBF0436680.1 DUF705 domain-containing protein [Magnetococcales bacterium]